MISFLRRTAKFAANVGLTILAILFTDLSDRSCSWLQIPVTFGFIVACAMNVAWMVAYAPQAFVAYVALFAGLIITTTGACLLTYRLWRRDFYWATYR